MTINRIKVVLVENGRKNKWLAKEIGKSESTISNIARALEVDIRELLISTK